MSAQAKAGIRAARVAAAPLEAVGDHKAAEDVRRLCRQNEAYRQTCSQLWKGNIKLRTRGDR